MRFTVINQITDFLFPRHCSVCGRRLNIGEKGICSGCLLDLRPSEFADGHEGNVLERTLWLRTPIQRAGAFLLYDRDNSQRKIVLDLKYHNRSRLGYHIAPLMIEQLKETNFFETIDLILPIPISKRRQMQRGYNQSLELAKGISKHTHIPINTKSITRKHYSTSQTRLTPSERQENVKGTFILKSYKNLINKHVLIVDDVITSTATILSCTQVLNTIPGIKISVLSLAVSRKLISNIRNNNPLESDIILE